MMLVAIALLEAAGSMAPLAALDFDLATLKPAKRSCGAGPGGDIVVCGRAPSPRLVEPAGDYADRPVRAGIGLGGGASLAAGLATVNLPGASSQRLMVTLKIPLGRKKPR